MAPSSSDSKVCTGIGGPDDASSEDIRGVPGFPMLRLWVTLNFDLWVTMFIKFGGACQTHPISPSVLSTRAGRRVATVLEIAYQNLSKIHWHRHLLIPRNLTIVPRPSASFYAGTLLNAQPKTSRCHHPKHPNSEALRDQLWRKKYWAPGRF